jgi:hypothetical protein
MLNPFLPPPAACKFLLDEYGIKRSPATLAKQRVVGGNAPPFRKANRAILYAVIDLRDWANAQLSARYRTTSEYGTDDTHVTAAPSAGVRSKPGNVAPAHSDSRIGPAAVTTQSPAHDQNSNQR